MKKPDDAMTLGEVITATVLVGEKLTLEDVQMVVQRMAAGEGEFGKLPEDFRMGVVSGVGMMLGLMGRMLGVDLEKVRELGTKMRLEEKEVAEEEKEN